MADEKKEKPLEKMTAVELREVAKEIPEIVGASGMNKNELVVAIKEARGIPIETRKKSSAGVREIKVKIRALREKHGAAVSAEDEKMAGILRKKIIRLKKKTRRAA